MPREADDLRRAVQQRPTLMQPPGQHPTDGVTNNLLVAAGTGDRSAFAVFYDRTASVVFGTLRGVLVDSAGAERATERVYLHLWRTAPHFDAQNGCAYSLLLYTTRRELASRLHDILTHSRTNDTGDEATSDGRVGAVRPSVHR